MEEEDCFDVFGYLKKLRQSRKGLIETMVKFSLKKFKIVLTLFSKTISGAIQVCVRHAGRVCGLRQLLVPRVRTVPKAAR